MRILEVGADLHPVLAINHDRVVARLETFIDARFADVLAYGGLLVWNDDARVDGARLGEGPTLGAVGVVPSSHRHGVLDVALATPAPATGVAGAEVLVDLRVTVGNHLDVVLAAGVVGLQVNGKLGAPRWRTGRGYLRCVCARWRRTDMSGGKHCPKGKYCRQCMTESRHFCPPSPRTTVGKRLGITCGFSC